ncbi:MAG: acyltransferase [Chloroflexi bacterium]|nr:acyltransferase [Chloroflexota bacterium]
MNRQYGAMAGLAIVLVVLNHAIVYGLELSPVTGALLVFLNILKAFGVYAVPTFLFISGAFVAYASRGKASLSPKFIWSSLRHILLPYLLWTFIAYLDLVFIRGGIFSVSGYIKNVMVGFPYHFVPLIIFYYVLSPLLVKIGRRYGGLLLLAIGFYQLFLLIILGTDMSSVEVPADWTRFLALPVLRNTMKVWGIYFPMGFLFSLHNARLRPYLTRFRLVFIMVTAVLFIVSILRIFSSDITSWIHIILPLPFMFVLPVIQRTSIPKVRQFEKIGRRAYGLYLVHLIVLEILLFAISSFVPGLAQVPLIIYPLFFVCALVIPLFIMERIAHQPVTRRIYRYVFG